MQEPKNLEEEVTIENAGEVKVTVPENLEVKDKKVAEVVVKEVVPPAQPLAPETKTFMEEPVVEVPAPEPTIYKRSTRSGELCIPCAFFLNQEVLTPQEAYSEKLCDQPFLDSIAHLQPKK